MPDLGLREITMGDVRELTESYRVEDPDSTDRFAGAVYPSSMFNDRQVDQYLTQRYLEQNQCLIRYYEAQSQATILSRDDLVVLFPRLIHGFVLRSRTWGMSLRNVSPIGTS